MEWTDIIFFTIVALLANYYGLRGILPMKRIILNTLLAILYYTLLSNIIELAGPANIAHDKPVSELDPFFSLTWYNLTKPTGLGILLYAIPLVLIQLAIRRKLATRKQYGFRSKWGNILGSTAVSLLHCIVISGALYFCFVLLFDPPPINPGNSKFLQYLSVVEAPLRKANKYDYWMYGYLSRDRHLDIKLQRELHREVSGLSELDSAKQLVYWVGANLEYDPIAISVIQPLFPGFNFPIEKVLKLGKGVSLEFARLYNAAATCVGLKSRIVVGKARLGQVIVNHCWNEVLIDGKWVGVDPTWSNSKTELHIILKEEQDKTDGIYENVLDKLPLSITSQLPEGTKVKLVEGPLLLDALSPDRYMKEATYELDSMENK